jgi:hypothetical protein
LLTEKLVVFKAFDIETQPDKDIDMKIKGNSSEYFVPINLLCEYLNSTLAIHFKE